VANALNLEEYKRNVLLYTTTAAYHYCFYKIYSLVFGYYRLFVVGKHYNKGIEKNWIIIIIIDT
jgi:hypothetical protein